MLNVRPDVFYEINTLVLFYRVQLIQFVDGDAPAFAIRRVTRKYEEQSVARLLSRRYRPSPVVKKIRQRLGLAGDAFPVRNGAGNIAVRPIPVPVEDPFQPVQRMRDRCGRHVAVTQEDSPMLAIGLERIFRREAREVARDLREGAAWIF